MLLLSSLDDDDEEVVVVSSRRKSCLSSSLALALGMRSHALPSVSQNSQTLKCVLLSDDTERDRERPRERLSEREKGVICAKNKRRAKRMARLNV